VHTNSALSHAKGGKIPHRNSSVHERETFIRAKYEAGAFIFPVGPLSNAILPDTKKDTKTGWQPVAAAALPTRLVDYFCTISASPKLERDAYNKFQDLSKAKSFNDFR